MKDKLRLVSCLSFIYEVDRSSKEGFRQVKKLVALCPENCLYFLMLSVLLSLMWGLYREGVYEQNIEPSVDAAPKTNPDS